MSGKQGFRENGEDLTGLWVLLAVSRLGLVEAGTGKRKSALGLYPSLSCPHWPGLQDTAPYPTPHSREQGGKAGAALLLSADHFLRALDGLSLLACDIFL